MKQLQQQALLQAQAWSQDFQHCALKLWINRSRLKTWNTWNEERRRSLRVRKAVRCWSQRVSTKALIKWKSWGRETERLQALGVRALGRWRRKTFSLCWNGWHKNLLRSKRLRLVLRCFVLRWTHRGLSKCWETWRRELRLTSITTVVSKRWANRHIHAAWEAWILSLTEIKRLKTVVKRVTARIQNICLAKAYIKFGESVRRSRKVRKVQRVIITRWLRGTLMQAYNQWSTQAAIFKKQRSIIERVLARMGHIQMAGAFDWWKSNMEVSRNQRWTKSRVLTHRLMGCSTSWALRKWVAWVTMRKQLRTARLKIQQHVDRHAVCRAWFAMVVFTEYMTGLNKYIAIFDDVSMKEIIEGDCRVWEDLFSSCTLINQLYLDQMRRGRLEDFKEYKSQLYLDQMRRRRLEDLAAAWRGGPKLQPLAGSGYHHSVATPRKTTPLLEALSSDPLSLLPGTPRTPRIASSTPLRARLSPRDYRPESRMTGINEQPDEARFVQLLVCSVTAVPFAFKKRDPSTEVCTEMSLVLRRKSFSDGFTAGTHMYMLAHTHASARTSASPLDSPRKTLASTLHKTPGESPPSTPPLPPRRSMPETGKSCTKYLF
jgi:hypothetical protein